MGLLAPHHDMKMQDRMQVVHGPENQLYDGGMAKHKAFYQWLKWSKERK